MLLEFSLLFATLDFAENVIITGVWLNCVWNGRNYSVDAGAIRVVSGQCVVEGPVKNSTSFPAD
jgi:hypothetical protein